MFMSSAGLDVNENYVNETNIDIHDVRNNFEHEREICMIRE